MKKLFVIIILTAVLLLSFFIGCECKDPYIKLSGYNPPENISYNTDYQLEGTIESSDIVECAGIRIKDNSKNIYEVSKTLNNDENVFYIEKLNKYVDFNILSEGEKTIEIIAVRNNELEVLEKDIFYVEKN